MKLKIIICTIILFTLHFSAQAKESTLEIGLAGDVMLGRLYQKQLSASSPTQLWGGVKSVLRNPDITLINQEFTITKTDEKWGKKAFYFRSPPRVLAYLKGLGVDYVSLANNHMLDFSEPGLVDTLKNLGRTKIKFAGAGMNRTEAEKPAWLEAKGAKIAILSVTDNMPAWSAGANKPGTFYLPVNETSRGYLVQKIRKLRQQGADFVVVSWHWGGNWVDRPSSAFKSMARGLIDGGADLIHGHSAHVFQGIEIYKGKPIFHNMGDLINDYIVKKGFRNDLGMVAQVEMGLTSKKVQAIRLFPTQVKFPQVDLARGAHFHKAVKQIKKLSAEMGTKIVSKKKNVWVEL